MDSIILHKRVFCIHFYTSWSHCIFLLLGLKNSVYILFINACSFLTLLYIGTIEMIKHAKDLLQRILQVFSTLVQLQITIFFISMSLANPFVDLTYSETENISFLDLKM